MAPFEFRLESVLKLRREQREKAAAKLSRAASTLRTREAELQQAKDTLAQLHFKLEQTRRSPNLHWFATGESLALGDARSSINDADKALTKARDEEARRRKAWIEAKQAEQAIERLREKAAHEYARTRQRFEDQQREDLFYPRLNRTS